MPSHPFPPNHPNPPRSPLTDRDPDVKQPKTDGSSLKQGGRKSSRGIRIPFHQRREWEGGSGGGRGVSLVTWSLAANNREAKEDAGKKFPDQAIAVTGTFRRK